MLWPKIILRHETLSIKSWSFYYLPSRIFLIFKLLKVTEHSSMKIRLTDTVIAIYMPIYLEMLLSDYSILKVEIVSAKKCF